MLAVMFKLLPDFKVRNLQAIIINYFTCFILGCLILGHSPIGTETFGQTWFGYALFLSAIFIIFFNINALTVQKVGMIITSIFQKLSLVFPVFVGIIFFKESAGIMKIVALPLTIAAIIFTSWTDSSTKDDITHLKAYWYLPVLVLFGSGLIEVTLFFAQETGKIGESSLDFTTMLFVMAGLWGLIFLLMQKKLNFKLSELIAGVCIGVPNFFTIYLLLKALDAGWDGSVLFPVNNVGTIFFTALIAFFIFKERLNKINYLGLVLAILAVYLISQ